MNWGSSGHQAEKALNTPASSETQTRRLVISICQQNVDCSLGDCVCAAVVEVVKALKKHTLKTYIKNYTYDVEGTMFAPTSIIAFLIWDQKKPTKNTKPLITSLL